MGNLFSQSTPSEEESATGAAEKGPEAFAKNVEKAKEKDEPDPPDDDEKSHALIQEYKEGSDDAESGWARSTKGGGRYKGRKTKRRKLSKKRRKTSKKKTSKKKASKKKTSKKKTSTKKKTKHRRRY